MVTLDFTLTPEATVKLHDIITCLGKFSETVSIEARRERLAFMALNPSKTAYASLSLDSTKFFSRYQFIPGDGSVDGRFTCSMLNKALLSIFKSRVVDTKAKDTALDRCEVSVHDRPDETACRFIVKMICNNGITKTYQLTYESVEIMHALFDKSVASNRWKIQSTMLKGYTEFFGPKTEQLDIYPDGGKVTFMSFTEKLVDNRQEILKHPLQTSVTVHTSDFEEFKAQEKMHIIINVKDFKAVASHAATLDTVVVAYYSYPSRPMQFSYGTQGINCEFTVMTTGDSRNIPQANHTNAVINPAPSQSGVTAGPRVGSSGRMSEMPPPAMPTTRASPRKLKPVGAGSRPGSFRQTEEDPESLFVPQDDDQRWDPADYAADEDNLAWDASADNDLINYPTVRDSGQQSGATSTSSYVENEGIAPTQRVSQVRGALW